MSDPTSSARVALLCAIAACGAPKDPNHAQTTCLDRSGASDDRSAFVYADDAGNLVVWTATGARTIKRPGCLDGADTVFVAPGGIAVAGYGTARMLGDFWGHSTPQVTAHCVVDVATGRTEELAEPSWMVWVGTELVPVPRDKLPAEGTCVAATTASGPVAACVAETACAEATATCTPGTSLALRRYRGATLDTAGDRTWPLSAHVDRARLVIGPDGKRVAIWDATKLRVIEIETGRELMSFGDVAAVEAVELDPAGGDRVMLIGKAYEVGDSPDHHIRIVGFDGRVRATLVEGGADREMYWTEPGRYWSAKTCGVDHRTLPPGA